MATGDFDSNYSDNPWSGIATKERQFYDPILRDIYRELNVFGQFTTFAQNLRDRRAKTMTITSLFDVHPNTDPLGLRQMWKPAAHVDSQSLDITFNRYGNKVAYMEYDDLITYWQESGGSASALQAICGDKLGQNMAHTLDLLSRNGLLTLPYKLYGGAATTYNGLNTSAHTVTGHTRMTTQLLDEVHLGMKYRSVPYAVNPNGGGVGTIVCVTSPGVLYDLQQQSESRDWIGRMQYASPTRLLNYEVGTFRNVRFVETPKCTLWNCGAITVQANVTAAIQAGDGAPEDRVDGVYQVGQVAATNFIQLKSDTDMSLFVVNDMVTLHIARTSANGVTNGVDHTDGKLHNRRIVAKDASAKTISFDVPVMEDFTTDLGSGVYGYVTKGIHVHASIFIGGPDAIVQGVGRPPRLHMPRPVDDFDQVWRLSWDGFLGYGVYNPKVAEVVYSSGSTRVVGGIH